MMNEEEYLNSKMGRKNPFTVPEGYFEQLTAQIMDKLPQAEVTPLATNNAKKPAAKLALIKQLRPWLYAAACLCVGVFIAALAFNNREESNATQRQTATVAQYQDAYYYSDNYIDEEADYAMVDNQEIYACLLAEM